MAQAKCWFSFEIKIAAGETCPRHTHSCTEIVYLGESSGWLFDGMRKFRYEPGNLLVYQPGTEHWVENQRSGVHICVGVTGGDADRLAVGTMPTPPEILPLFHRIRDVSRGASPLRGNHLDLLAGLLAVELNLQSRKNLKPSDQSYAAAAREIIDTRFDEPLSLDDIASSVYISPDYLRQLFRREFGQSPIHYLIRRRVDAAGVMLQHTNLSISEIAERCGFATPFYFSRMFRKLIGQSPSKYRRGTVGK